MEQKNEGLFQGRYAGPAPCALQLDGLSREALTRYNPLASEAGRSPNIEKEADEYVLGKRAPAGVIVDGSMNIVQFRGAIGQFLELVPGTASFHLFKLAKEGLLLELRPAILKAKRRMFPSN